MKNKNKTFGVLLKKVNINALFQCVQSGPIMFILIKFAKRKNTFGVLLMKKNAPLEYY